MNSDTPLVCNMGVFSPEQRERHIQSTLDLARSVQSFSDRENGYQFTFPNETELILKIAEFISNERLCCPFLKFQLEVLPNSEPISLLLSGPVGTQEFLRAEFGGAIP